MSQPPSLPTLTSFLRQGSQQQQQQQQGEMAGGGRGVAGDDGVGRGPPPEKRRLEGSAMHGRDALYDDEVLPQQQRQQKRRANLFLQYGEQQEFGQQQQQRPVIGGYDPRLAAQPPPQRASPHLAPTQTPQHHHQRLPPPPAQQQRQTMAFPDFAGNYDRNSIDRGRLVPPVPMPVASTVQEARRAVAVKTESPSSTQEPTFPRERTSRYLSEADRRSIILRIDNGEKQVALAKEYQVSRAAICNLYKNRKEVLTRADKNPKAKHPKRLKDKLVEHVKAEEAASDATPPGDSAAEDKDLSEDLQGDDDHMSEEHSSTESNNESETMRLSVSSPVPLPARRATPEQSVRVYNLSATSAPISRLISMLRNPRLPLATYRQVLKRLSGSLLEEVVARLPRQEVSVVTSSGYPSPSIMPLDDTKICGISIDPLVPFMVPAFLEIFPAASTGMLSVSRNPDASSQSSVWRVDGQRLPSVQNDCVVLLFVASCSTGAKLCAALEHLTTQARILPSQIYVAMVISSQPGVARVHRQFPDTTIFSAAIDEGVDTHGRIRPGIGDLMERFCH